MGRESAMMNSLIFLIAFYLQWPMGVIISLFPISPTEALDPHGCQVVFLFLLVVQGWYWVCGHIKSTVAVFGQSEPL